LQEGRGIFVGGPFDDAPCPSLEVVFFVGTDRTVACSTGIAEGKDIAVEFEFGQGNLRR
jgi:hypothetical protein